MVSLWDSAEQFRAFPEERLHLTLDAGDGQPTVTLWEIEMVHRFDWARIKVSARSDDAHDKTFGYSVFVSDPIATNVGDPDT